jgi:hypothetical protein
MTYARGWIGAACALFTLIFALPTQAEPPLAPAASKVIVVEPTATTAAGAIQGVVSESDRPQPYLGLVLLASNGSEVGATRTNVRGTFLFQNLSPGTYTVVCRKEESSGPAVGTVRVTVQSGKVQDVVVRLAHRAPFVP